MHNGAGTLLRFDSKTLEYKEKSQNMQSIVYFRETVSDKNNINLSFVGKNLSSLQRKSFQLHYNGSKMCLFDHQFPATTAQEEEASSKT